MGVASSAGSVDGLVGRSSSTEPKASTARWLVKISPPYWVRRVEGERSKERTWERAVVE